MPFVPIKLMKTFFSLLSLPPEEARPATLPFPSYRGLKNEANVTHAQLASRLLQNFNKPGSNPANIKIRFFKGSPGEERQVQSFQRSCMAEVKD